MKYLRAFVFFLLTIIIYLGIPLLGWGLDSLDNFFSVYSRAGYALVVIAFGLAVGYQAIDAPEGIRGSKGDKTKLIRRQSIVRIGIILLMYVALFFLPFADRHNTIGVWGEYSITRWLGLILSCLGYGMIYWSGLSLGKQYSQEVTLQLEHHLITSGAFRYIRHPRYLGVMLLAIGLTYLFRSWFGLIASIVLIVVLLFRIRDEETLLHQAFGKEWESYCGVSWRLIPYIY